MNVIAIDPSKGFKSLTVPTWRVHFREIGNVVIKT